MANLGVTFNKEHCSKFGLDMLASRRPLMPETKDTYIELPHKDGSILIPDNSAKDITVEVDFKLVAKTYQSLWEQARVIGRWLKTDRKANLVFDDDPNYAYVGKVVGNISLERILSIGKFTVRFRCSPYAGLITSDRKDYSIAFYEQQNYRKDLTVAFYEQQNYRKDLTVVVS